MNIFSLLGKILDDVRRGLPHLVCWCNETEIQYDCCTDFLSAELGVDSKDGCTITFRANDDLHFEIVEINYTNADGVEVKHDVRERLIRDVMSDDLLDEYHSLCDKVAELS